MANPLHNEALIRALRAEHTAGDAAAVGEQLPSLGLSAARAAAADVVDDISAPAAPKVGFVHRHPQARPARQPSVAVSAAPAARAGHDAAQIPSRVPVRLAPSAPAAGATRPSRAQLPPAVRSPAAVAARAERVDPVLEARPSVGVTPAAPVRKAGAPLAAVRGEVTRPKVEAARPAARRVKMPQKPQKGFFDNFFATSFGLLIGVNLGLHVAMGVVFLYYWSTKGFQ